MGRDLDYRYVNTMTIMEKIAPVLTDKIAPIMQEVWNDEAELLSGVPVSVKEGMQRDFLSFERMMEIGGKVTTADNHGEYQPVEEYFNIIENLKFDKLLEQYKKETFHECAHSEHYTRLNEIAEYVKQLKMQAKYAIAEAREREINTYLNNQEKAFEADYKKYILSEKELTPFNLEEKTAEYKELKEKAKSRLEKAQKEKAEGKLERKLEESKKDRNVRAESLQKKKEEKTEILKEVASLKAEIDKAEAIRAAYEKLAELQIQREQLPLQIEELKKELGGEFKEKLREAEQTHNQVEYARLDYDQKNLDLEIKHDELEMTLQPIMSELNAMMEARDAMLMDTAVGKQAKPRVVGETTEQLNAKYKEAYEKYKKAAEENEIDYKLEAEWGPHLNEYNSFKETYYATKKALDESYKQTKDAYEKLKEKSKTYDKLTKDFEKVMASRLEVYNGLKVYGITSSGFNSSAEFIQSLKERCEKVDMNKMQQELETKTAAIDALDTVIDASTDAIEKLDQVIETSATELEKLDGTIKTSTAAIEKCDDKLKRVEVFKQHVDAMSIEYLNNRVEDEKALQEIIENRKEYWNAMVDQFKDFNDTILDGSKSKDQKNSVEFERMKTALEKMTGLKNRNEENYKAAFREVKESAQAYLDAKNQQIRLLPSTQRKTRMQFTKNLIARCELVEKMDYKCVEFATQKDVLSLQSRAVKFSGANKEAAGIRKSATPEYKATAKKVFEKFYKNVAETRMKKENSAPQKEEVKTVEKKEPVKEEKTLQAPGLN